MVRAEELSDFQRGTIIGCHISKKSVCEISTILDMPRSTVSDVILKWKHLGATTALPRSGKAHKPSERDLKVLERLESENQLSPVATLPTELQNASGSNISPRAVRRELHSLGPCGQAAKPKATRRNAKPVVKNKERNSGGVEEDHGQTDPSTSSELVETPEQGNSSPNNNNSGPQS